MDLYENACMMFIHTGCSHNSLMKSSKKELQINIQVFRFWFYNSGIRVGTVNKVELMKVKVIPEGVLRDRLDRHQPEPELSPAPLHHVKNEQLVTPFQQCVAKTVEPINVTTTKVIFFRCY